MTDKKNKICDQTLDSMLSCYDVPPMDEKKFNSKLFACLGDSKQAAQADKKRMFFIYRPVKFLAVTLVVFSAVLLLAGPYSPFSNDAPQTNVHYATAPVVEESMVYEIAIADNAPTESIAWREAFFVEMADQDILLMDYAAGFYPSTGAGASMTSVDDFLDEVLGIESRSF